MVYEVCMETFEHDAPLKERLLAHPVIGASLAESEIDAILDPHAYVGLAEHFVDETVERLRGRLARAA